MPSIIPQGNDARITWGLNFEEQFPTVSADLGFSPAETTALTDDSATMRFVILNGQTASAFSKASNTYKYSKLGGIEQAKNEPDLPPYNPVTPPATIADSGIIARLNAAIARAKTSPNFNEEIADLLMINLPETDDTNNDDAKPKGSATAMPNSVIRIDWTKGKFDGVIIEGQRGDETDWTRLDRDFRSPFEDERPPLSSNKPEERRYRLIYFLDDETVGVYSDVIVVITMP